MARGSDGADFLGLSEKVGDLHVEDKKKGMCDQRGRSTQGRSHHEGS